MYTLYGTPGWGSAIVETQLAWYGLPFEFEALDDLFESEDARVRLAKINPLVQIPTLILPDGNVMTESAAITLHLAEVVKADSLVPAVGDETRPQFLRWLIYLVTNIYPTFTYADDPSRFVAGAEASKAFRDSVDTYAQRLWGQVNDAAGAPWFMGDSFTALDIYIGVMTRWRPRRAWFQDYRPKLAAIAERVDQEPRLAEAWRHNFPEGWGMQ